MSTEIKFEVYPLDDVIGYFTKDFKPHVGEELKVIEYYIDPIHKKVIVQCMITTKDK